MRKILLTLLSLALIPLSLPDLAQAQTSFGRSETVAPQNAEEWSEQTTDHLRRALRRSDSALNSVGANRSHSTTVAIVITRDGRVADVQIVESSGSTAMDAAFVRHFSRIEGIPAFTPDMAGPAIVLTLPIGTKRG